MPNSGLLGSIIKKNHQLADPLKQQQFRKDLVTSRHLQPAACHPNIHTCSVPFPYLGTYILPLTYSIL